MELGLTRGRGGWWVWASRAAFGVDRRRVQGDVSNLDELSDKSECLPLLFARELPCLLYSCLQALAADFRHALSVNRSLAGEVLTPLQRFKVKEQVDTYRDRGDGRSACACRTIRMHGTRIHCPTQ